MEEFVRPRDGEKLLPPTASHIGNVETKDEGERNHVEECIKVFDYTLKQPGKGSHCSFGLFTYFDKQTKIQTIQGNELTKNDK